MWPGISQTMKLKGLCFWYGVSSLFHETDFSPSWQYELEKVTSECKKCNIKCYWARLFSLSEKQDNSRRSVSEYTGWNILNNPAARRLCACCCCCCWNYPESATKLLLLHNAQQSNYTDSGGYPSLMATACRVQIYTARPAHAVQTGQEGSF